MSCTLCGLKLPRNPIDGFCCAGCRAVYQILSARGELADFADHPLYAEAVHSGVISNQETVEQALGDTKRLHLEIEEMWCPSCAEVIRLVLERKKGVARCTVDYQTDLATLEYDPQQIAPETLISSIVRLGYRPRRLSERTGRVGRALYVRLGIALFCAFNLMMLALPFYFGSGASDALLILSALLALPTLAAGWPIFRRAITGLLVGVLGMELLVTLGAWSAFGLSLWNLYHGSHHVYFDAMGAVIALTLLGRLIEQRAKVSVKERVFRLSRSLPRKARLADGTFVPIKEVSAGVRLSVCTGERIPTDGQVVEGSGAADESVITGEPLPAAKGTGDRVVGGSLLQQGHLVIEAEGTESTLDRIVATIQGDLKPPVIRPVDRVVRWFVPAVLLIGLFSGHFLAVVLISCPCAIGIAVPLVEALAIGRLAARGVIVRNRNALHLLGKERWVAFDKTGTVTEGKYSVLCGLEQFNSEQLAILKGLTIRSNHPVSVALAAAIEEPSAHIAHFEEIPGVGVRGEADGRLHSLEKGPTFDGVRLQLGDRTRAGLPNLGRMSLLSGDVAERVEPVAHELGFDEWRSDLSPLEKREWITAHRPVVMVGDGINDAPALAAADVGIAVTSASDMSQAVADILLTVDDLSILSDVWKGARRVQRLSRQNLAWAFGYNVLGVFLAATGHLLPIIAAIGMALSSCLVVLNALRSHT